MKNNKGITLIALVITIIILIILAGISISILMGENGLITKAKQGTQNYQNAAIEEQAMLNNLYSDFASGVAVASGDLEAVTQVDNASAATSDKILKDYKAYVNGQLITGTMNNYSTNPEKITLTAEQKEEVTIDIPDGYHTDMKVDASAVYEAGMDAGVSNFNSNERFYQQSYYYNMPSSVSTTTASDYKLLICSSIGAKNSTNITSKTAQISISGMTPIATYVQNSSMNNCEAMERIAIYKDVPSGTIITFSDGASQTNALSCIGLY